MLPKKLKATGGQELIFWPIYDTQSMGTTASAKVTFFQTKETSATNGVQDTNMPGEGTFPTTQSYELHSIAVIPQGTFAIDDLKKTLQQSVLVIKINDRRELVIPTIACASPGYISGFAALYGQSAATEDIAAGIAGSGFLLEDPLVIKGGDKFQVDVYAGTTAATTAVDFTVVFIGYLLRPTA